MTSEELERSLIEAIEREHATFEQRVKPYVDKLVELRNLAPMRTIFVNPLTGAILPPSDDENV